MNSGKRFEEDFRLACVGEVAITRLYDNIGGQAGVANICDFIVGHYPYTFYLELKSTNTGTLPLKNISKTQYEGLLEKSKYKGNLGGLLIKYARYNEHYFVNILDVEKFKETGAKSISYNNIKRGDIKVIPFPATLKRTRYGYNFKQFVEELLEIERYKL